MQVLLITLTRSIDLLNWDGGHELIAGDDEAEEFLEKLKQVVSGETVEGVWSISFPVGIEDGWLALNGCGIGDEWGGEWAALGKKLEDRYGLLSKVGVRVAATSGYVGTSWVAPSLTVPA